MDRHLSRDYDSLIAPFRQPILDDGQEGILEAVRILLNEWMTDNVPEGLTVFDLPADKRKKLRTSIWPNCATRNWKKEPV